MDRKLIFGITPAWIIIFLIAISFLVLHLINIETIGDANAYYTAAVKSMLQSWKNFFFVAAEPGGSVTVDKPPLGLWVETVFAYFLGVNGFSVSLPNILAGTLSVPLLFYLVKKYSSSLAGIIAALVFITVPVVVAADRNNTMDALLVFTLLLAAWAFIRAADTGKFPPLAVGALLIGLGFNIKMLQAYLVLPAFYALYLFGAKIRIGKKLLYAFLSLMILLVVSHSWVLIVDFTPTDNRPYIGSSKDNTVTELILGHNGLSRLFGPRRDANPPRINRVQDGQTPHQPPPGPPPADGPGNLQNQPPRLPLHDSQKNSPNGVPPANIQAQRQPGRPPGGNNFGQETGEAGLLRFFRVPLAKEMSWMLPMALAGIVLLAFSGKLDLKDLSRPHRAVLLWGGWLLTCLVFFSIAGFFHAYYMIMLAPPLGALVGMGFAQAVNVESAAKWKKWLWIGAALITLIFQVYLAGTLVGFSYWMLLPMLPFAAGIFMVLLGKNDLLHLTGWITLLVALLIIPGWFTIQTVLDEHPHVGLPSGYPGMDEPNQHPDNPKPKVDRHAALLNYLDENTQDIKYLVAVPNAGTGAQMVIQTGRPVLYMGGFTGSDSLVDASDLEKMVAEDELRFIFYAGGKRENDRETIEWLNDSCEIVKQFSSPPAIRQSTNNQPARQALPDTVLFDCK